MSEMLLQSSYGAKRPYHSRRAALEPGTRSLQLTWPCFGVMFEAMKHSPGQIFTHSDFRISQRSMKVRMSEIRVALRESGSEWRIACLPYEGYTALQIRHGR